MSELTDEIRAYLENLRETGRINMLGAAPYLESEFDLSHANAKALLLEWMQEPAR